MGLRVIAFINSDSAMTDKNELQGIPLLHHKSDWLGKEVDKRMQFIVAVENHQSKLRNTWLRELMIKGYRYVSVIPTLRGMPLDSTDMSFIFSHEVMIFRVHQNLAKWSSRFVKRAFDISASLAIIVLLSPVLLYIRSKVKKMAARQFMVMSVSVNTASRSNA
ncbi:undecaprenyl-phosphate galactose phosphotransferase [Tatumella ptyseos]|uniref:Undecaprenyl-phosphate galactose phosphotransferase n=1 Tax=Tatumella ptyseos TaxID=82987 RepID=A0A2X5NGH3_9GAMM|nr:undecaprenyl-phosphate galactose phosphotransferase [Tatumella ptyseos]